MLVGALVTTHVQKLEAIKLTNLGPKAASYLDFRAGESSQLPSLEEVHSSC